MNPCTSNAYIPSHENPQPLTIEHVREHGVIYAVSDDGKTVGVQVTHGMAMSFVTVTLTDDGKIADFIPWPINKYVQIVPQKRDVFNVAKFLQENS